MTVPPAARSANSGLNADERDFLAAIGAAVREGRRERGLSRRALAGAAGVSERYLAQLESGQGNASVLLLRRVTNALAQDLAGVLVQAIILTLMGTK